jgi:hypothetical protein
MTDLRARRIIGGMTYNTATSTLLATAQEEDLADGSGDWEGALYRTRSGAYFEVSRRDQRWHDARAGAWKTKSTVDVVPLDHAAAVKWCEENEADILVEFFDLPDEAGPAPIQSFPLRMSDILKNRLETKAKEAGLSMNAYTVQCLERCLDGR